MDNLELDGLNKKQLEKLIKQGTVYAAFPEIRKSINKNKEMTNFGRNAVSIREQINLKIEKFMYSDMSYEDFKSLINCLEEIISTSKKLVVDLSRESEEYE